jgi:hypothetical protein
MTRGWTAEMGERVIQVKERRLIKERNKGDKNSETWGGRTEDRARRLYDVQRVGKE